MKQGKVVVVANQKGGVGKSTLTFNLQYEFSMKLKLKTLVIDFDPQATLTGLFDIAPEVLSDCFIKGGISNIFERKDVYILRVSDNVDFIPSDKLLGDSFYSSKPGKELMLKKYLAKVRDSYDIILIDTKPDIQAPIVSAIVAADVIVNPIKAGGIEESATMMFYTKLDETVDIYNLNLEKVFVVPTMVEPSTDSKEALYSINNDLPLLYSVKYDSLKNTPLEILKPQPRRAVFANATGVKIPLRQYIEEFDKGKKDILLDLEQMAKKIAKAA